MADSSSPVPHWKRPDSSRPAYNMPAMEATMPDSSITWNGVDARELGGCPVAAGREDLAPEPGAKTGSVVPLMQYPSHMR
jgi:hypothetical protein